MSMSLRLISLLMLSIAAAFAINEFGFGIAHSVALGLVAFLCRPGSWCSSSVNAWVPPLPGQSSFW
jgi:hypothetical protein